MLFYDLLANGQPDARTGICAARVQPLEHLEEPRGLGQINADTVITHSKLPVLGLAPG